MRAVLLLFLTASTAAASAPSTTLDARLLREADRLEAAIQKVDAATLPKEVAALIEPNRKLIADVRTASATAVRLRRLSDAYVGVETLRYVVMHANSGHSLEALRTLAASERAKFGKPLPPVRRPALETALQQIAANRADKLFQGAVAFGKAASPFNGLYYLGEAEANRGFAAYLGSFPGGGTEARPERNAIAAALARLDESALAVFETDPAGRSAIGLSARLKEARELLARGGYEGSALLLLQAQLDVSTRKGGTAAALTPAAPRADSIVELWQAMRAVDEKTAAAIDRDVLPLYASLFRPTAAPKKITARVTVTLVRWPYT